jgi:Do/DeqQ family serine protease
LTNYHVVRGFDRLAVKLYDGSTFKGKDVKLVGTDAKTDLAVLKLETQTRLHAARLGDSDSLKVGEWAIAVGNAFGLQSSVTVGVISALGRSGLEFPQAPSYQDFIQTDAAINPGNSGGPLLNIRGEVIGINTAITSTIQGNIGIGFAIPINSARLISDQIIHKGKVIRGYLGISVQAISPDLRDALGLPGTEGVLVGEVVAGTPADKAGLKSEDVITRLNGEPVTSVEHFRTRIAGISPGATVQLTVLRERKETTVEVKLAEMPGKLASESRETETTTWLGLQVRDLYSNEKKSSGAHTGVKVEAVEFNSSAGQAGILVGDIILTIAKRSVYDVKSFKLIVRSLAQTQAPIPFSILRGRARYSITVTPE